jgi:hypothetical protein
MALDLVNPQDIPADLAPGTYCCRLADDFTWGSYRVRFVTPPRSHEPGDCLIQLIKEDDGA